LPTVPRQRFGSIQHATAAQPANLAAHALGATEGDAGAF